MHLDSLDHITQLIPSHEALDVYVHGQADSMITNAAILKVVAADSFVGVC